MNWGQFKDSLCYLCLHGAMLLSLSVMQEVVGSRLRFFTIFFLQILKILQKSCAENASDIPKNTDGESYHSLKI